MTLTEQVQLVIRYTSIVWHPATPRDVTPRWGIICNIYIYIRRGGSMWSGESGFLYNKSLQTTEKKKKRRESMKLETI